MPTDLPDRPPSPAAPPTPLRRARRLARVLDTAVRIPGTRIRVGLDPILGLLPGGGDLVGALLSGYIVIAAARLGVPPATLLRMLANLGVDALFGAVPLLGDLFDVGFRANARNVALIEREFGVEVGGAPRRPGALRLGIAVAGVVAIVAVVALGAWGVFSLLRGLLA